ncbi:hypothetical protein ABIC09_002978 [Bradyrhizobium sp. S3.12.5]|uniref:DUF6894 domain-containing protein n=1 Tax=Bradyrhizobium cytisi TaxID=515489 RepID=A0A5S4WDB6_9BRAD|nr:hypothetical protein [Bradyrhizobium cytisi]TYL77416.1 hypothetical protein FXB38_29835 [Bradyrhizobium cytisi]
MPRFFFVVADGRNMEIQNDGLELPDRDAAWVEATTACGELLRDLDGKLLPGDQWCMKVKDATGADIYLLEFKTSAV